MTSPSDFPSRRELCAATRPARTKSYRARHALPVGAVLPAENALPTGVMPAGNAAVSTSAPLADELPRAREAKPRDTRPQSLGARAWDAFHRRAHALDPYGWAITVFTAIVAAFLRLPGLSHVAHIAFDETYYVKDAYTLMHLGYEAEWKLPDDAMVSVDRSDTEAVRDTINTMFASGDYSAMTTTPEYVVHPQTGKWLISLGMRLLDGPAGWRIATALFGIVLVILTARLAWHLWRDHVATACAGLFIALDGVAIVMSRFGLLDGFLAVFALAAMLCVVIDRERSRPILLCRLRNYDWPENVSIRGAISSRDGIRRWRRSFGPHAGNRPWLIAAGILCGLATSVKWSGLYVLAALGLFVAIDEMCARRAFTRRWVVAGALIEGIPAFFAMVPTAALAYLLSWWSWFAHRNSWGRSTDSSLLGMFADLMSYHAQAYEFHRGLSSPHSYMSSALDWMIQRRPTSFVYDKLGTECGGSECVRAVLAVGNPVVWWVATLSLVVMVVSVIVAIRARRRTVTLYPLVVIGVGLAGTHLPWFLYLNRTTFNFYTVIMVPYVALAAAWLVTSCAHWSFGREDGHPWPVDGVVSGWCRRRVVVARATAVVVPILVLAVGVFFLPLWDGSIISYSYWHLHMWFPSWI